MNAPAKRSPIPFGKYLLLDRINVGGMAEVWRGKTFGAAGFERIVAIKRILPNIAEDDEFIAMFKDEARITVDLNHANIAQVYEFDEVTFGSGARSYYIAMEYVAGRDLRAIFDRCRKRGEPAPVPLSCFVVSRLCEGLDYAHRKKDALGREMNIVHRDVSPQNVLISYEGEIKIIDFGIAKAVGKATKTQAGIIKGKFAYMSPEQIRGMPLDRRSDVFAIGICLWEVLTGERLFVADSDFAVLEKVRKAEVPPPSTLNRRVPPALDKVVLKALARNPEDRYQYASDLGDELQRFLLSQDAIFGRKDLMQYMKSTFAEDVEREKLRRQEYAEVRPPTGALEAAVKGIEDAALAAAAAVPDLPKVTAAEPAEIDDTLEPVPVAASPAAAAPPAAAPPPPSARPAAKRSRGARVSVVAAAAVVAAGAAFFAFRPPAEGLVIVDLPQSLRGAARVNVAGQDLGAPETLSWPIARRTPAGSTTVVVSARGHKPFTTTVDVKPGTAATEVRPQLEAEVAPLVLGLLPADAEVRIDGTTVKREGDASAPYVGELALGREATVEVRRAGYRPFAQKIVAANAAQPIRLHAELEALRYRLKVVSTPPGATILVGGREVGVAPAEIEVPHGTTGIGLARKCFDDLVVPVKLPDEPGDPLEVPGALTRQPGCR